MAPKNRIIIDTDPGVDDILALLLALTAHPDELEVVMISVTYGNVSLQRCLRNVVALFHVLEKEIAWRRSCSKNEGFEALKTFRPIVAVGAEHPLEDDILKADDFHGADGLHGVHAAHPDLSPADTWSSLFASNGTHATTPPVDPPALSPYFTPSKTAAHKEMLRILKENPDDTVTIVAVGPLTNVALAAAEDPQTFLRVKELVVMGGAVHVPGNMTPVAEFNCAADAVAAARVYALTSSTPSATMPPFIEGKSRLGPYLGKLPKKLLLSLFPLDITTPHLLGQSYFSQAIRPLVDTGSPLARWIATFMLGTFDRINVLEAAHDEPALSLHDPLTIWYMMTRDDPAWKAVSRPEDIRVETTGQWTCGMHVIDGRNRRRAHEQEDSQVKTKPGDPLDAVVLDDVPHEKNMSWLNNRGNRINRILQSPGEAAFAPYLMQRILG